MPRKQRFKPSRKPKPIPAVQVQEGAEIEQSNVQLDQGARAPEPARPDQGIESRTHRQEEIEAR